MWPNTLLMILLRHGICHHKGQVSNLQLRRRKTAKFRHYIVSASLFLLLSGKWSQFPTSEWYLPTHQVPGIPLWSRPVTLPLGEVHYSVILPNSASYRNAVLQFRYCFAEEISLNDSENTDDVVTAIFINSFIARSS